MAGGCVAPGSVHRGRRRGSGPREQSGCGEYRATAVAAFVAGIVMAIMASIGASESLPENRGADWSSEQPRVRQQTAPLHTEERRTRAADSTWSGSTPPLWLWRHLDALPRRLDAAEARLARIEALIELRLDQMAEGERSRNAKDDLWRDQESRRIESSFDRLERRLAYMETRLAEAATADRVAAAAASPRLQEQLRCQQEKLEESVEGVKRALVEVVPSAVAAAVVERWKTQGTGPTPTPTLPLHLLPPSHQSTPPLCPWAEDHVANVSREAAETLRFLKQKLTEEFGLQADNFVTKVGNMYNDLWQRAQSIESLLKDSLNLGNSTQRDLHEGFRALVQQQQEQLQQLQQHNLFMQRERHGSHSPPLPSRRVGGTSSHGHPVTPNQGVTGRGDWSTGDALELGLGSLELSVDTLSGTVARRLGELGRRLDSSFRMLLLAQNLFLESCHRIQLGEPTLEARLSLVLERLLDTVSNRSQWLDQEAMEMKDALPLQTSQIITALENFVNSIVSTIREGNEWLSAEIVGSNQKTKEEISVLANKAVRDVVTGVSEAIKPDICSSTFSLPHDNSNFSSINKVENGDHTGDNSWKEISSDALESDFEFHHVTAVVKNTGSQNNHSVVAFFHQTQQGEDDLNAVSTNETANLKVQIHQNPMPESINNFMEKAVSNIHIASKENQGKLLQSEPLLKAEEFVTTTDPIDQEQLFEHEIQSTTSTAAPNYKDRIEHKRSTDNESDSTTLSVDNRNSMEADRINEKKHLQAIIAALIDHFSSWDGKNHSELLDVNPINSSIEELKQILKDIISRFANEKSGIKDINIKFNETLEFAPQYVNLIHFAKAMIKMYEAQDLDLNLDNFNANIPQISQIKKERENSYPENENEMESNTDHALNHTEPNIASLFLKRINTLASKLDSKPSKSP